MPPKAPLFAAMLKTDGHYIDSYLALQARYLGWDLKPDWQTQIILLAPQGHLHAMTENTQITDAEETGGVTAGVTGLSVREDNDYVPDISELKNPPNNWLMLGDPRAQVVIDERLKAAAAAGCRLILCIPGDKNDEGDEGGEGDEGHQDAENAKNAHQKNRTLQQLTNLKFEQVVFALLDMKVDAPAEVDEVCLRFKQRLKTFDLPTDAQVIVGGDWTSENISHVHQLENADGVLIMDDRYGSYRDLVQMLQKLNHRQCVHSIP